MILPRNIYDTWEAVADKFKVLHQGTDDQRREATKRGVQTIRARHGAQGSHYICKSQHNTGWAAASKDALAYVEGTPIHGVVTPMVMWDMINGVSRETNAWPIEGHDGTAYILIPEAYDWLEDEDTGNGDGGDIDDGNLQEQIDELKQEIIKLKATSIRDGDKITIKIQEWDGKPQMFFCGDRDTGNRVIANRTEAGTWEVFIIGRKN